MRRKIRPYGKKFSLYAVISSRDYSEDKLLPPSETLKGFKQEMIESYFHFTKLIIQSFMRCRGSRSKKTGRMHLSNSQRK